MRYILHPFESRYRAWKNLFIINNICLKVDIQECDLFMWIISMWRDPSISVLCWAIDSQNVGFESGHHPQLISLFQEAVCSLFFNGQQRRFEQQCYPNHSHNPDSHWWQQCMCQSVILRRAGGFFNLVCLNKCRSHMCQIVVLEEGRVVERASHEVLLGLNGRYAQLWNQQNSTDGGSDTERTDGASDITLGSSTSWYLPGFLVVLTSWDEQEGIGQPLQK